MPVIRQQRTEFLRPAQVNRMDTGAADYAQAISRNADQLAGIAFQRAAQKAEEVGTERALGTAQSAILTINPETGRPEAFDSFAGMGEIANQAFKRIVDNRFRTEIDADLRQKSAELASQNPNPEAYASAFSSYAGGLVENADPMYREFVMTTSTEYLEKTKLNLVERARAAARAENQRFLFSKLEDIGSRIEEASLAGNWEEVDALKAEGEALAADGLASKLIREDQVKSYTEALNTTTAASISGIMATEMTQMEQADARQFFITNGEQGSLPDTEAGRRVAELMTVENRYDITDQFDNFARQENARRSLVLEEFSRTFESAVTAWENFQTVEFERQQAEFDQSLFESTIRNESIGQDEIARLAQLQRQYNQGRSDPFAEQDRMLAIQDAITATPNRIAESVIRAEQEAVSYGTLIEDSKRNSLRTSARRSGLQNIISIALATNPEDRRFLQTAITSPSDSEAFSRLSPLGQAAAVAARRFYDHDGDRDALSGFMKMSDNEYLNQLEKNRIEFGIKVALSELNGRVENGVATLEDVAQIQEIFDNERTIELISPTELSGYADSLKAGNSAIRIAELVSQVDSETGEAIQDVFNARGGEVRKNALGPELAAEVEDILRNIPEGKRGIVSTALDRSLNDKIEAEQKLAAEDLAMQNEMNLLGGIAEPNRENAELLQDVLSRDFGLDPQNPETWNTPEVQRQIIQSGLAPAFMQDGWIKLARGATAIANAEALIQNYIDLRDYQAAVPTPSGRTVVIQADVTSSLTSRDRAILDAAYEVSRQVEGAPIGTILEGFNEIIRDDSRMNEAIKTNLGGEYDSVTEFLASMDLDGAGIRFDDRPDLIREYANYAAYFLATTAGSPEAVRKAITQSLESRFVMSNYVMDVGMTPDAGRSGAVSEFSPKRFEMTNPALVGAEDYVYKFFVSELRRLDPSAFDAEIPIGTPRSRGDGGYMIQVQPQSVWPNRVIYSLVKEQDGVFVPAIFEDQSGEMYIPAFDSSVDFGGLIEANKAILQETDRPLPMSDRFEEMVNEPTLFQKTFGGE